MKRTTVALLLTAAVLLLGAGCPDQTASNEADGTPPPPPPPAEVSATEADPAGTPATEPDDEGAESASTEEAEQETPSADEEVQGVDADATAVAQEPEDVRKELVPDSDDRALEDPDLEHLDNWGLTLARNEIFARHGRSFENQHVREHFEGLTWYSANPEYDSAWLSATEQANASFILKYQKLKYDIPAKHP